MATMKMEIRVFTDEEKPLTGLKLFMPDIPEPLATVDLNESETRSLISLLTRAYEEKFGKYDAEGI